MDSDLWSLQLPAHSWLPNRHLLTTGKAPSRGLTPELVLLSE